MPLGEVTGRRPSNFSAWHRRKLPDRCALADVDWCEVREGSVVAILETIQVKPEHIKKAGDWILTDPWLAGKTTTEIAKRLYLSQQLVVDIIKATKTNRLEAGCISETPPVYNVWNYQSCDKRFGQFNKNSAKRT